MPLYMYMYQDLSLDLIKMISILTVKDNVPSLWQENSYIAMIETYQYFCLQYEEVETTKRKQKFTYKCTVWLKLPEFSNPLLSEK